MAAKKKKAAEKPAPEPESIPEPILIIEAPEPAPEPAPVVIAPAPTPEPRAEGSHSCTKCGKKVAVYETICSQTVKGYCSTACFVAR